MDNQAPNPLYPIFLKLHELQTLLVGGGEVGYEKLFFILKSSPDARITVVAFEVQDRVQALVDKHPQVHLERRFFQIEDLEGKDLVILATNRPKCNEWIKQQARARNILTNVADTPVLCDFYLGSIVTRGPLKVGISTNGQSPTFAKRFRQILEDALPNTLPQLIANLKVIRDRLTGDFEEKVERLNEVTASLVENEGKQEGA
ncbi:MAG: bifunctional precorrin-2 dehydrogenase/sirohydrochlorin ferrochelatase [Bacteroidota bacterium]